MHSRVCISTCTCVCTLLCVAAAEGLLVLLLSGFCRNVRPAMLDHLVDGKFALRYYKFILK